jgi:membrane-bound lytic murein transglycosylase B
VPKRPQESRLWMRSLVTTERLAEWQDTVKMMSWQVVRAMALGATPVFFAAACVSGISPSTLKSTDFDLSRPDIVAFIDEMVAKDGFSRDQVTAVVTAARFRPEVTATMDHPAETTLAWWQYRQRFVTASRIQEGVIYWHNNSAALDAVAAESGVPPEYVVAILGIETNYGRSTGAYREIDTLMTFAFDYPARAEFYRGELRQFLLLARDLGLNPIDIRGSYGGALGAPQMMPSNYRHFVKANPEEKAINLWTDSKAIITSTADFLRDRGWIRDAPVLTDAQADDGVSIVGSEGLNLNDTVGSLKVKGVRIEAAPPDTTPVVLIQAALEHSVQYRVGFNNFYVISRYNPRVNYAMAVCDLAQELRHKVVAEPVAPVL